MKLVKPKLGILKESSIEKNAESGDNNNNDGEDSEPIADDRPSFFGVRSYIHHFYEPISSHDGFRGDGSEDLDENSRYLIAPKDSKKASRIWRFFFWTGLLLLLSGSLTLIFTYFYPREEVIIGQREEMQIIDPRAFDFNKKLDFLKILGLIFFCLGGCSVAVTLILPTLIGASCLDADDEDDSPPFKVMLPDEDVDQEMKVPATQKVTSIQPSRPAEESIVTESGLTKMKS
ncbi:neurensin-1-like [Brevipalpus obovatus]|uniref:neurensin-1-like n=1 Tax=Brevipalpus obovatus TaxID=246614 RepID=UPI003D9DB3EB